MDNHISAIIFLVLSTLCTGFTATTHSIHFLKPSVVFQNNEPGLKIFCHNANTKDLIYIWKSLTIHLSTNTENYDLYNGKTPQEVMEKYENQRYWRFNLFGRNKSNKFQINPFEDVCIGVYVYPSDLHKYSMGITETRIDVYKLMLMILGTIIYWNAHKLSGNCIFYYLCGTALGTITSVLIFVYYLSKLLPRGKIMYLMVATSWTMSIYIIQALWDRAHIIIVEYREWITLYILLTSFMSFIICYWFGPITNARTKKVIEWLLQIGALFAMYHSSYFREVSIFSCIVIILLYNFPIVAIRKVRSYWKKMYPQRRKLLTENQYHTEGIRETNEALSELKEYCASPKCNPWKTVLILKDPIRFARFVEGESHLSDDETREHDAEITKIIEECEYTDDEDEYLINSTF
ncbi:PREDICTED: nuclear envelope integral membrane protein 1-like [Habropoda laboriosa]|uniref:nuclear envelope integral membrane protein 1-like n=1 Tax=Habropoda laboriosa TaxID=597456 RepID=UPI00083D5E60|nr:PREDICTED: nuclear envelope integral membrane protein 1-like [Habropoda laboriosa]